MLVTLLTKRHTDFPQIRKRCAADPYLIESRYLSKSGPVQHAIRKYLKHRMRGSVPNYAALSDALERYFNGRSFRDPRFRARILRSAILDGRTKTALVHELGKMLGVKSLRHFVRQGLKVVAGREWRKEYDG